MVYIYAFKDQFEFDVDGLPFWTFQLDVSLELKFGCEGPQWLGEFLISRTFQFTAVVRNI